MKSTGIKMMLLAMVLMEFSVYAVIIAKGGGDTLYEGVLTICSMIFPIISLPMCFIGLFMKK